MKKIFDLLRKHEDKVIHQELYDKYVKKTYIDKYDLLADACGIILGSIFRLII